MAIQALEKLVSFSDSPTMPSHPHLYRPLVSYQARHIPAIWIFFRKKGKRNVQCSLINRCWCSLCVRMMSKAPVQRAWYKRKTELICVLHTILQTWWRSVQSLQCLYEYGCRSFLFLSVIVSAAALLPTNPLSLC